MRMENLPDPLPTMQQNALCLLLGRRNFSPAEVAQIDYRRLEKAPRIGRKGILVIRAWLNRHGFDLTLGADAGAATDEPAEPGAPAIELLNRLVIDAAGRDTARSPILI
jgi:hypothetical protein